MENLVFWQTVGAVIVANAFCCLTAYMVWQCARAEKGKGNKPGVWVYIGGLLAPAVVVLAAVNLP